MDYNNDKIVEVLLEEIRRLPDSTEISTSQLLKNLFINLDISDRDKFDIDKKLKKRAEEEGIILDKSENGVVFVGLPFNITFIKREKNK